MTAKYHIKDDGTPGICNASSLESCPKAQSGDSFHGSLQEANAESEKRFKENYGNLSTSSKQKNSSKVDEILSSYNKLVSEHGATEDLLRTRINKTRSATAQKRAMKAYDDFNKETGWKEKMSNLNSEVKTQGYESISELKASVVYAERSIGNGGMSLPPKISKDQALPYTLKGTKGWLVATNSDSEKENQHFIYQDKDSNWVAARVDKTTDPLSLRARHEIRADNLKTFTKNVGSISKPTGLLAGKYSLDGK